MTKATTNVARVAAAVAGLGLVAMSLAPMAGAQTSTTTTTTTTTASASFTRDLHTGSTGADVTALQTWLIAGGYSIPAGATGYFGSQTKAAVAAFQAANSITPAAGYFGPITRAKVAAMGGSSSSSSGSVAGCAPGAAYSSTTGQPCGSSSSSSGSLSGGEGSIDNLQVLGSPSNTTIYQGQSQQVYGFKFQADGSSLQVNRVDFDFTNNGATVNGNGGLGQDRPWAVFQTATLYDGSKVIGTVDASNMNNWSQDGTVGSHQTYRLRFDGMNDVVNMGSQATYYLSLTAQNGISTPNQTQYNVNLTGQGIRATDAKGLSEYSNSTAQNIQTVSVSNAAAGTVVLSAGSDNPSASTVMANQSAPTQNVVLGTFTINSQNAATMLYTLPVTLTASATSTNGTAIPVQDLKLVSNGQVLDSEAILSASLQGWASTTYNGQAAVVATTTFKNLNLNIPAGTTQSFQITGDINPVGGTNTGNALEGSFAQVAVTPSNLAGSDIEQGSNRITVTGGMTGNQITFHVNGASVDSTPTTSASASAVGTSGTQQGNYTFTFNVTAFGQTVYVSKNAATAIAYSMLSNGSASAATSSVSLSSTAQSSGSGNNYVVNPGQSSQFTVLVTVPQGNNTPIYAKLNTLNYALTDVNPANTSSTQFNNNYQTAPVFLHS